jgi:peptidoglycan hydrolase-like protein with peptidoglycan-binding domain
VTRTDLTDEEKLRGTLGYGDAEPIGAAGGDNRGTITVLPAAGTVLRQGHTLWEVDGHAGPALFSGSLPLWRTMRSGVQDGADIRQLEQNLTDLGFGSALTVDEHWDSQTTAAVKAWQDSRGLKKTGAVNPGDVVVTAGPVRVAELKARVGDPVSAEVFTATASEQVVTLDVSIDKVSVLAVGAAVKVQLPDDSRVDGTVQSIGRVATVNQDGSSTIRAVITLSNAVTNLDAAPVSVVITSTKAAGVLVVPIRALLALAEGGYAVERVDGASTRLVGVKTGAFGDGVVAITGAGIAEGDSVVVAP